MRLKSVLGISAASIATVGAGVATYASTRESHVLRFRPAPGTTYRFRRFDQVVDPLYKSKRWHEDVVSLAKAQPDASVMWACRTAGSKFGGKGLWTETVDALGCVSRTSSFDWNDPSGKETIDNGERIPYANDFPFPEGPVRAGDTWSGPKVRQKEGSGWCECKLVKFGDYQGHRAATIDVTQWRKWDGSPTPVHFGQRCVVDVADGLPRYVEKGGLKVGMPRPGASKGNTGDRSSRDIHMDYFVEMLSVTERVDPNSTPPQ